jgi:hypothetical protein
MKREILAALEKNFLFPRRDGPAGRLYDVATVVLVAANSRL